MLLSTCALVAAHLAQAAPPEAPAPLTFEAAAADAIHGFFAELETGLGRAMVGDAGAERALGALGEHPERFEGQVASFAAQARQLGALPEPRIVGFEVEATLWYGIVPMRRVQLYFWRQGRELRLLRLSALGEDDLHFFDQTAAPHWQPGPGAAMGFIARQVVEAGAKGGCGQVPLVRDQDFPAVLPKGQVDRAKTLVHLDRFRRQVGESCASLAQLPFDHITWRLGEAGGVLKSGAGDPFSFRVSLARGGDGQVRLDLLTRPVGP